MAQEIMLGKRTIGLVGPDNVVNYDMDAVKESIKEIVAGQTAGSYFASAKVIYRWDRSRKTNNDAVYKLWKSNPLINNRINQMNSLIFGRGLKWIYDESTQMIIDRFWRTNRFRDKLNPISTDCQLYGETFIALYPQPTGDVKIGIYEANQVEIDFTPGNVYDVNKYIIVYKDEEKNTDMKIEMLPIDKYLNEIEYATPVTAGMKKSTGTKNVGLNGAAKVSGAGAKGVMIHLKFNNSTTEIYGTSDFKQVFDIMPDYMNFVGDRLTIHQLYGSPSYDITIDTDDPEEITKRITELAGFTIGSNPVHNKNETWKPLEFSSNGITAKEDESVLRGLLCAGTGFPEHLLFNQAQNQFDDNTFAVIKLAEDRQESFRNAISDIHKFVVAIAGGDPLLVDDGQLIFPEVNVMSEKTKAEKYVLEVGANVCSRKTASINMGHNWGFEEEQMLIEMQQFGALMNDPDVAGAVGGRFTTKKNNQDPSKDDGVDDKVSRLNTQNISTQVVGDRKTNN
jgi:hypothetical protein